MGTNCEKKGELRMSEEGKKISQQFNIETGIQIILMVVQLITLCFFIRQTNVFSRQAFFLSRQVETSIQSQKVNSLISLNQQIYPCPRISNIISDLNKGNKLLQIDGGAYSEAEIDNFLGYFEMLGLIEEQGYLDHEMVHNIFGYDIEDISRSKELTERISSNPRIPWLYLRRLMEREGYYSNVIK